MDNRLGWILDEVVKVPETRYAILLSGDGLLMAHSDRIGVDDADRHAAGLSGLQSLARNCAEFCGSLNTQWRQTVSEFDHGYVLLVGAGPRAYLAISTTEKVDLEVLSFRAQETIQRLGKELTSPSRGESA